MSLMSNSTLLMDDWNILKHGMYKAWSNISELNGKSNLRIDYIQTKPRRGLPLELLIQDYKHFGPEYRTVLRRYLDSLFFLPEIKALEVEVTSIFGAKLMYSIEPLPLQTEFERIYIGNRPLNSSDVRINPTNNSNEKTITFAAFMSIGHR